MPMTHAANKDTGMPGVRATTCGHCGINGLYHHWGHVDLSGLYCHLGDVVNLAYVTVGGHVWVLGLTIARVCVISKALVITKGSAND